MSGDTRRLVLMARNPGGTKKAQLERALRDAGWWVQRERGKHEIWTNGAATVPVPRTLKGKWTIGEIAKRVLAAEGVSDGG